MYTYRDNGGWLLAIVLLLAAYPHGPPGQRGKSARTGD